jgi:hypothetical protein
MQPAQLAQPAQPRQLAQRAQSAQSVRLASLVLGVPSKRCRSTTATACHRGDRCTTRLPVSPGQAVVRSQDSPHIDPIVGLHGCRSPPRRVASVYCRFGPGLSPSIPLVREVVSLGLDRLDRRVGATRGLSRRVSTGSTDGWGRPPVVSPGLDRLDRRVVATFWKDAPLRWSSLSRPRDPNDGSTNGWSRRSRWTRPCVGRTCRDPVTRRAARPPRPRCAARSAASSAGPRSGLRAPYSRARRLPAPSPR